MGGCSWCSIATASPRAPTGPTTAPRTFTPAGTNYDEETALGKYLKFRGHVKRQGIFSMRHSLLEFDSTWTTTWFLTFFRQRLGVAVTGTNAANSEEQPQTQNPTANCPAEVPSWASPHEHDTRRDAPGRS